ncbi:signal peptide peptidase SppA [Budviciaceae bacterium CWB-B4]|uniref:Signal peptide peptidase SppA n=1 Tax=Limnobaculum xujianqingii TaxID=2738837 RepID=A0A9D7AJW7_9GAMM|nr:signal peptide peptidase SppA [Limnobaculum xujianqingii]MBK5073763.1 signal peptide peptidase SppA [Limnobaculum xujianqingii]MBK5177343.1 signal peptide peptidase SppA [Limnobaculum xujianqingii]
MRALWQIFATIFKFSWRVINFIRQAVCNLIFFFVLLIGFALYIQVQDSTIQPEKGALLVNLSGTVVDSLSSDSKLRQLGQELIGSNKDVQENSLFDIVKQIRQAKDDDKISGIVLSLGNFIGADQPSLRYIGKALKEFRDSGKPIYAIGDSYSQGQYYLASFANKIYLSPQGSVLLTGISTNNLYYKSLLDKLKVTTNIFRVGTYKSAVEPFIRDNMSPEARQSDSRWVNTLWSNYMTDVAANRNISIAELYPEPAQLIQQLKASDGDTAAFALKSKLVDEISSRSAVEKMLKETFGWDQQNKNYNFISIYNYQVTESDFERAKLPEIAVVFANGAIVDGPEMPGMVGGDTTAKQLRAARLNDKIKAIVLRVNSPGGSVTASEMIRSEVQALKEAGKPVVVSMGGMAASGGYWISTPADYIISSPSTLTGSIGIFGVINTFENSLDVIGVHTDGVSTSPLADATITKALPPQFSEMMQLTIENGYRTFINLVAKSRHKTPAEVDSIAQGRVWIGSDAKSNGLVDQLGDFDDAIKKAAELAKLKDYEIKWTVTEPTVREILLGQVSASVNALLPETMKIELPAPLRQVAEDINKQPGFFGNMNDPGYRYIYCLSCSYTQ